MPYGGMGGRNMRGKEKMILTALFLAAWIGIWMTGPEDPMDTYGRYDWWWFWAGFVLAVVYFVHCFSEYVQRREAEKRARAWRRRDARTNR